MSEVRFAQQGYSRRHLVNLLIVCSVFGLGVILPDASGDRADAALPSHSRIKDPIVVTQIPVRRELEQPRLIGVAGGMLRADYADGARLIMVFPDLTIKALSRGFYSACDPEISFDASHILFAGKRKPTDDWNIFEIPINGIDGSNVRQVTSPGAPGGDCRSPCYQPPLYTIAPPKPKDSTTPAGSQEVTESWADMISLRRQIVFVGSQEGLLNECGVMPVTNLYSCKLDGSAVWRLTFNLSGDMDPFLMYDGRLLFASWQPRPCRGGLPGRIALFGVNIDGTDLSAFCTDEGKRIKLMPCTTTKGLAVFVEADPDYSGWDGSGSLGSVRLARPLHSYRPITKVSDGLFHSPSPLPDGRILVSRRSSGDDDTHAVYCLDPAGGEMELIFDAPDYHDIQAKAVQPRPEPDGRSSVVTEKDPHGKLYCLNVYINDLEKPGWLPAGTIKRLRVLEGIAVRADTYIRRDEQGPGIYVNGIPSVAQRRILGEIDIEEDGSFNIELPANVPIELQTLDADGMALRSCSWIWAKNHEPRGCIGCHEDGELTPENMLPKAVTHPSIKLTLPAERRRTVDFRRDVMPVITQKCVGCHAKADSPLTLTQDLSLQAGPGKVACFNQTYENLLVPADKAGFGKYVNPGRARSSPLIWRIFGRDTSRPWDDVHSAGRVSRMPPAACREPPGRATAEALTEDERRTFVEWIDLGALWDGIPGPDNLPGYKQNARRAAQSQQDGGHDK